MAIGGRAGESFSEINVTPLTDVFLVLLVIMILIAPLVNQTVLKVDPPSSGPAKQQPPDKGPKIDVEVLTSGIVKINGQSFPQPDTMTIARAIQAEQTKLGKQDLPLNLSAEGDSLQKFNVAVMDAAAGCGI
jgi:biopolymer transport protein ExbD/biopolymer transport protein TolR